MAARSTVSTTSLSSCTDRACEPLRLLGAIKSKKVGRQIVTRPRMVSNLPSTVQQEIEIGLSNCCISYLSHYYNRFTERYAHVAHERCQGSSLLRAWHDN
jgi:hypothetical protein